jgi:DNA primase
LAVGWNLAATFSGRQACGTPQATVTKKREGVRPLNFHLRGIDARHPYVRARGIWEGTAAAFGVGFYAGPGLLNQRLVIPIHNEVGQLVAYCGRSLDGAEPRYKFPTGFAKSQVLFNFHRAATEGGATVIVVEGFFDCFKVHQAGYRSVAALMGAALSDGQRGLLRERFRSVILMLDGDQPGRRASAMIASRLATYCAVRVVQLADNTQPDQLSEQAIQEILTKEGGTEESC